MKAVERYDPKRGRPFIPFAYRYVHGSIHDRMREQSWIPRLEVSRTADRPEDRRLMVSASELIVAEWVDSSGDVAVADPFERVCESPDHVDAIASADNFNAIVKLVHSGRTATALTWYYRDGITMKAIGQRLGLSESAVSQMISRALAELAGSLTDLHGEKAEGWTRRRGIAKVVDDSDPVRIDDPLWSSTVPGRPA